MNQKLSPKPAKDSAVETSNLVLPSHANALGSVFGGVMTGWMDITAAICAQKHSHRVCVTASIDALNFITPVHVGDTVTLRARVVYTGRSSMMIYVDVTAQNLDENECRKCVDAYLTFVALDKNRKPQPVPPLLLQTDDEKREFKEAAQRRQNLLSQK